MVLPSRSASKTQSFDGFHRKRKGCPGFQRDFYDLSPEKRRGCSDRRDCCYDNFLENARVIRYLDTRRMIYALFLLVSLPLVSLAEDAAISPIQAIQEKGSVTISAGSSFYTVRKDGAFDSGPLGFRGRTISGRWRSDKSHPNEAFVVDGQWRWINGPSRSDDHRRIVFDIWAGRFRKASAEEGLWCPEIFQCYFLIEELVPQSKP